MTKYKRILSVLETINELFQKCQVKNFQKTIEEYITLLSDMHNQTISIDKLNEIRITLFGGMGSLNDVLISKDNEHKVEDEDEANQRLDALREQLKIAWREEIGSLR